MSINSAMLAGVTGLVSNSSALAAISDNIANVNTVGYKRSRANFQTLVTNRGASASYAAGGVTAQTRRFITTQGLPTQTTSSTDLISGQGFFMSVEKAEGLQASDVRSFTRAGSFQLDSLGYLKNDAGLYLQGPARRRRRGHHARPVGHHPPQVDQRLVKGAAEQTTRATVNANLKSSQTLSADVGVYNAATNSMAMYDPGRRHRRAAWTSRSRFRSRTPRAASGRCRSTSSKAPTRTNGTRKSARSRPAT